MQASEFEFATNSRSEELAALAKAISRSDPEIGVQKALTTLYHSCEAAAIQRPAAPPIHRDAQADALVITEEENDRETMMQVSQRISDAVDSSRWSSARQTTSKLGTGEGALRGSKTASKLSRESRAETNDAESADLIANIDALTKEIAAIQKVVMSSERISDRDRSTSAVRSTERRVHWLPDSLDSRSDG